MDERVATVVASVDPLSPTNPPFPIPSSSKPPNDERKLVAIVFTDAAGITSKMQRDEAGALQLLEQDFARMRHYSDEFGGTILKTTGDGLLMYFKGAAQALGWALKTQRHFAERAKHGSETEILRHRVGIHVGEVYVRDNDVLGDGVNLTSRVQGEAPNGGICLSHAAYEAVKGRIPDLHVIKLEPRKLKNISGIVQMYHVRLEPPDAAEMAARESRAPVEERDLERARPKTRSWQIAAAVAIVAAVGVGGVAVFRWQKAEHERQRAANEALRATFAAEVAAREGELLRHPETEGGGAASASAGGLDFARMTGTAPATSLPDADRNAAVQEAKAATKALFAWLNEELKHYTRERPLLVRQLTPGQGEQSVFTDGSERIFFATGGGAATRVRDWADLRAEQQGAVIVSALRNAPRAPAEAVRGAEAFGYLNGLPEMADVLTGELRAGRALAPQR